jgi:cyclomaltodextrin glucanotransferase
LNRGSYKDYLGGLLEGVEVKVLKGNGENIIENVTLPKDSVSVWTNVKVR